MRLGRSRHIIEQDLDEFIAWLRDQQAAVLDAEPELPDGEGGLVAPMMRPAGLAPPGLVKGNREEYCDSMIPSPRIGYLLALIHGCLSPFNAPTRN